MKGDSSSIVIISSDSYFNTSVANECYSNNINVIFNNDSSELFRNIKDIFKFLIIIDCNTIGFNEIIQKLDSKVRQHNTIIAFDNNECIQLYRKSNPDISELLLKKNIIIKKINNIFTQFNVNKD